MPALPTLFLNHSGRPPARYCQEGGPFPTVPRRTGLAPFSASGSPGRWLHRSRAAAASTAPFGLCPPSPAALPPVSGITLSIRGEVEGRVLIAQEHQPSPPEPDVRLVT